VDVEPWPIKAGDYSAEVTKVTAAISGQSVPLVAVSDTRYEAVVRTDDPKLFVPPLNGEHTLRIDAVNKRMLEPGNPAAGLVTRTKRSVFVVDNTGPTVRIDSPLVGELVGGVLTIQATITDEHGVNNNSVLAALGLGALTLVEFPLPVTTDATIFTGRYDLLELRAKVEEEYPEIQLVFPTLSVRATDMPGNETIIGQEIVLDYTPPKLDLDPPTVRLARESSGSLECSQPFDPLGSDAVNNCQTIAQLSELRARVQDRSNSGTTTSKIWIPMAGMNSDSVQLFILGGLSDRSGAVVADGRPSGDAVLVDTNNDGRCDEVNPLLIPAPVPKHLDEVLVINLSPKKAEGKAWFTCEQGNDPLLQKDFPKPSFCGSPLPESPPDPICRRASPLTIALAHPGSGEDAIYMIPPIDDSLCMGLPFDSVANHIPDGWACIVARGKDMLGNVGVSPPMRVCIDHDLNMSHGCAPAGQLSIPPAEIDCMGTYKKIMSTDAGMSEVTDFHTPCTVTPEFAGEKMFGCDDFSRTPRYDPQRVPPTSDQMFETYYYYPIYETILPER
ncbi:MAG: hypothetical protein V2A73_20210, partial [Pseudomonadota bacterium]